MNDIDDGYEDGLTIPVSDKDHSRGPADAPVTLVEYGDYECPYCGAAYPVVKDLQNRLGDNMQFVFRNFPLTASHPHAEGAAEAAEAAGAQGKFWEMHDTLYENQGTLDRAHLHKFAGEIGLDMEQFKQDLDSRKHEERVHKDFMGGVRSGVNGTPTFFINGTRYNGRLNESRLMQALEEATQ